MNSSSSSDKDLSSMDYSFNYEFNYLPETKGAGGNKRRDKNKLARQKERMPPKEEASSESEVPIVKTLNINGNSVETCDFDGILVLKEDWERLVLFKEKIETNKAVTDQRKVVRRKAEKFSRRLKKICLGCGFPGHAFANCLSFHKETGVKAVFMNDRSKNSREVCQDKEGNSECSASDEDSERQNVKLKCGRRRNRQKKVIVKMSLEEVLNRFKE